MNQPQQNIIEGILFTDQYQLTMAQLYYQMGLHETEVQFEHFFRRYPNYGNHRAGYCINAGLAWFVEWMQKTRFQTEDIDCLRSQKNSQGKPLFAEPFLSWLQQYGNFDQISIDAIPEGRVVHPHLPLTVVRGPLIMAQILETALLNHLNYPILIATKAARMAAAAQHRPLLEFGLRRAQGQGANAGIRAALIGGANFTSNTALSHRLGLPPKGTHAHSMIQLFMAQGLTELDAFMAYAELYPDDCLLLIDTINTLESGLPHAIQTFEKLRRQGHKPVGVRIDSGDLALLSMQVAKGLNEAGFHETGIVLSSDLDELAILTLVNRIKEEATVHGIDSDDLLGRLIYGAGTRLITSWGEPALGGVYKLVATHKGDEWRSAVKISDTPAKIPNPGLKRAWRLYDPQGFAKADLLTLRDEEPTQAEKLILRSPVDASQQQTLRQDEIGHIEPLHQPIIKAGKLVYEMATLDEARQQRQSDLARLKPAFQEIVDPEQYQVSLSQQLWGYKQKLIEQVSTSNSSQV